MSNLQTKLKLGFAALTTAEFRLMVLDLYSITTEQAKLIEGLQNEIRELSKSRARTGKSTGADVSPTSLRS